MAESSTSGHKNGAELIAAERALHPDKGHNTEEDDSYANGELAQAAMAYLFLALGQPDNAEVEWPWDEGYPTPLSTVEDLVRAGSLVAAEIDRLQRIEQRSRADG